MRAVRGGQYFNNFVDNCNGTITDTSSGLMWQKDTAPGTYSWQQALSYCENLSLADYNDWRLPDRNELDSLTDYNITILNPATTFLNTLNDFYWSSTTPVGFPGYACTVNFSFGVVDGSGVNSDKSYNHYVRAVRGG